MSKEKPLKVWLLKEGEPLPLEPKAQKLRCAMLAEELANNQVDVLWFTSSFSHGRKSFYPQEPSPTKSSNKYRICFLKGPGYTRNVSMRRVLHQLVTAIRFLNAAKSHPLPDAILAAYPTPELAFVGAYFAKKNKIPFILDVRDPWPDSFKINGLKLSSLATAVLKKYYRFLYRYSARHSRSICSMSKTMLGWAQKTAQLPTDARINDKVFYLGCKNEATKSSNPSNAEHAVLTCVFYGMFGSCHNGKIVVEAAKKLNQNGLSNNVKFIMAGDGELKQEWQRLASGQDNIIFTGWLDKHASQRVLEQADVGIISISGAINNYWFGNKFYEYIAADLAIINDCQGELQAFIAEAGLGINIAKNSASQLASAITFLLMNPDELAKAKSQAVRINSEFFNQASIYRNFARHVVEQASS